MTHPAGESNAPLSRRCIVIVAIVIALILFVITYVVAWGALSRFAFGMRGRWTEHTLWATSKAVKAHVERHARPPATLDQLDPGYDVDYRDEDGTFRDGWEHELWYAVKGDGFEICSYGRDGLPGGVGVDTDTCDDGRGWAQCNATLRQFTFEDDPTRAVILAAVAGIMGAALFTALCRWRPPPPGVSGFVTPVMLSLVLSVIAAFGLVVAHIPTGH